MATRQRPAPSNGSSSRGSTSRAKDAEAILLVGDIFDFWFEYRRVIPTGYARVLGKLAELTDRGVRVVLFTGNHDMWTGDCLARECGVEVCTSPQVMTLCGRRIFIAHGDNMQIDGQPLLKLLNRVFRSRALRWLFSWGVHPDWAVRFGRWWSGRSRKSHHAEGAPTAAMTEPLIEYSPQLCSYPPRAAHRPFRIRPSAFRPRLPRSGLHTVHLGCWEETLPTPCSTTRAN